MIKIKEPLLIVIILILFVIIAGSFKANRDLSSSNETLRTQEADAEMRLKQKDAEAETLIKSYEERIDGLNANIDSSNLIISNIEIEKDDLGEKIKSLEGAQQNIKNKDDLILNLQAQVNLWKQRFSLARLEIEEKDKIIFSLSEKYESARGIIIQKDIQLHERDELISIKDLRIGGLEKQIKADKFWGKLKNYAIVGGSLYILINALAGAAR